MDRPAALSLADRAVALDRRLADRDGLLRQRHLLPRRRDLSRRRQPHQRRDAFDPNALSSSGYVYNLLLNPPVQPYDLGMFYSFSVPVDGTAAAPARRRALVRGAGRFPQSVAFLRVAATTQTLTLELCKNDDADRPSRIRARREHDERWRSVRDLHAADAGPRHPVRPRRPLQGRRPRPRHTLMTRPPDLSMTIAARTGTIS